MRRSKYGAVPTVVDGIRFHSRKEARRYQELRLLEKAGAIRDLQLQYPYELHAPSPRARWSKRERVGVYKADFRYREGPNGVLVVEDVKGVRTALFTWKKRHVLLEYGIAVQEV